jgi:hypothetical protein
MEASRRHNLKLWGNFVTVIESNMASVALININRVVKEFIVLSVVALDQGAEANVNKETEFRMYFSELLQRYVNNVERINP